MTTFIGHIDQAEAERCDKICSASEIQKGKIRGTYTYGGKLWAVTGIMYHTTTG